MRGVAKKHVELVTGLLDEKVEHGNWKTAEDGAVYFRNTLGKDWDSLHEFLKVSVGHAGDGQPFGKSFEKRKIEARLAHGGEIAEENEPLFGRKRMRAWNINKSLIDPEPFGVIEAIKNGSKDVGESDAEVIDHEVN